MTQIPAPGVSVKYLGPDDPDWALDPQNIALLLRYLEDNGLLAAAASVVVLNAKHYTAEFQHALAWRQEMAA